MTEKEEKELRKEALSISDMCCEIKDALMRLGEEKAMMSSEELGSERGARLEAAVAENTRKRREYIGRIDEINRALLRG